METKEYSEGKFDLKITGDFISGTVSFSSSITDDQVKFKIEVESGQVYIHECLILHKAVMIETGFFGKILTERETLTVEYNSGLIRFIK